MAKMTFRQFLLQEGFLQTQQIDMALQLAAQTRTSFEEVLLNFQIMTKERLQLAYQRYQQLLQQMTPAAKKSQYFKPEEGEFYSKEQLLALKISRSIFDILVYEHARAYLVLVVSKNSFFQELEIIAAAPLPSSLEQYLLRQSQMSKLWYSYAARDDLLVAIDFHYQRAAQGLLSSTGHEQDPSSSRPPLQTSTTFQPKHTLAPPSSHHSPHLEPAPTILDPTPPRMAIVPAPPSSQKTLPQQSSSSNASRQNPLTSRPESGIFSFPQNPLEAPHPSSTKQSQTKSSSPPPLERRPDQYKAYLERKKRKKNRQKHSIASLVPAYGRRRAFAALEEEDPSQS